MTVSPTGDLGYTDLILTCEVIKKKDWRVLQYRGYEHLDDFLKQNPDSYQAYQKAVWDSHTSLYAKKEKLTNTQLLRGRLYSFLDTQDLPEGEL